MSGSQMTKVDRRDPVIRHRWDTIIRDLAIMGPSDLMAKEIVAGLKVMRIEVDLRMAQRIVDGFKLKKHGRHRMVSIDYDELERLRKLAGMEEDHGE
jgi:hypothetical protein